MKIGKFEIDSAKAVKIGATMVSFTGMVLSSIVASNDQKKLKIDLKNEILNELKNGES